MFITHNIHSLSAAWLNPIPICTDCVCKKRDLTFDLPFIYAEIRVNFCCFIYVNVHSSRKSSTRTVKWFCSSITCQIVVEARMDTRKYNFLLELSIKITTTCRLVRFFLNQTLYFWNCMLHIKRFLKVLEYVFLGEA